MQALGRCEKHGKPLNDFISQLVRILCIPEEACFVICRKTEGREAVF